MVNSMAKSQQYIGYIVSVETLQRRIGYGGKKGAKASRRLRRTPYYTQDRESCKRFFASMPKRSH